MRSIHRPLLIGVLHVVQHPVRVLLVAGACVAACALLAAWKLNISSDQNKLFDPNVQFFRDFLNFSQNFPENEATYVVIQSANANHPPPTARWTAIADAITARLRSMPEFVKSVDSKVPIDQLGAQGLLFDDPQRVRQSFNDVKRFIPLVKLWAEKPGLAVLLGRTPLERFLNALRTQKPSPEIADFITLLAKSWNYAIEHPDAPLKVGSTLPDLASLDAADPSRLGYYYVPDESDPSHYLMLVRVYQRSDYDSLTAISETIEAIRDASKDAAKSFPEFTVAVTGRPALEADEMRTTDTDSHRAEIVAAIAVFIGLVAMLRSIWLAFAGEIALAVGIAWTFGWATLSVGELNLLSVVFLLALIGIGMDYLVQILTRYRQEVARRDDPKTIWMAVFHSVSLPINTACLGAAGAFLVSVLTHFRGAAQLGIIAGGGLVLCLLAGYVILPALLTLVPLRVKVGAELPDLGPPASGGKHNLILPLIWLFLLAAGVPFMQRTQFDPGLLTMQAPNLESVRMVKRLQTWSAVVLSKDLQTLRAVRDAMKDAPTVESTESILTAYDNLQWLRDHEKELPAVEWSEPASIESKDLPQIAKSAATLAKTFTGSASDELKKFARLVAHADPVRLTAWQ
ncbi:MAG TPA: MMPL family transporter, partial [Tepidisphaeraceae bacterium]|nr:MMPL family transporter [Tepidisphaeraceae bacterium]